MSEKDGKEETSKSTPTLEETQEELERTRAALKKANSEAAERRHKLKDLEAAEKERQEVDMSEQDKLKKQLAKAEQERDVLTAQVTDQVVRSAVLAAAAKLEFANPEDAYKLIIAEADVEVDGNTVKGFKKPLEELAKSGRLVMKNAQPAIGTPTSLLRQSQGKAELPKPVIRM